MNALGLFACTSLSRQVPCRLPLLRRTFTSTSLRKTAAEAPSVNKMEGSYHWQFERYLSVGTLAVCAVPLMTGPSRIADFLLTFLLPLHCHLGFDQVITDYLNKRKIGTAGNLAVKGVVTAATLLTTYGLFKFNTNDVGITEFVKNIWQASSTTPQGKEEKH